MCNKLITLTWLLFAGAVSAQSGYSAKALFFGEDDSVIAASTANKDKSPPPIAAAANATKAVPSQNLAKNKVVAKPTVLGASYFIRLQNPDGTFSDVLTSRKFKTGERFQLAVKVNRPSHIYILNEGPDGAIAQIYPQPGSDQIINAMGVVFLPAKGAFEFDKVPGTEQLLVYMSPKPINQNLRESLPKAQPDMVTAAFEANANGVCGSQGLTAQASPNNEKVAMASTSPDYASKGISYSTGDSGACQPTPAFASKGIAFSDDPTPGGKGQVASYVVKTSTKTDENLFLKIKLTHQ